MLIHSILLILFSLYVTICRPVLDYGIIISPPFRVSNIVRPKVSVLYRESGNAMLIADVVTSDGRVTNALKQTFQGGAKPAAFSIDLQAFHGPIKVVINVSGTKSFNRTFEYEVVKTGVKSTRLLDAMFLDILHWHEQEALYYQKQLREMTPKDWSDQVSYMAAIGMKTAVIQQLFLNNHYVKADNDTCDPAGYAGLSFYPSRTYTKMYPNFTDPNDKVEAILTAADKYGVSIFIGIGVFEWFDFRAESLCWHKKVVSEIWDMYGHHPSLYGWYISEEDSPDFFQHYPPYYYAAAPNDTMKFFREFRKYVDDYINPLMPVMFSTETLHFDHFMKEWQQIFYDIDIYIPAGFARTEPGWDTLSRILQVCNVTGTKIWVDLEVFSDPGFPDPLVPKSIDILQKEILNYDVVEQILGYEFTGLMDSPKSRLHLGGKAAAEVYQAYEKYYKNHRYGS